MMSELVSSITNLCKLLNRLLGTSITPEYFRLLKLNKLAPEQTHQLLDICHKLSCSHEKDNFYYSCEGDPLKCIESLLCRQDRGAAYFISPAATPRQLLLCLAFLLSERTIESNIDKTILATPLADEIPSFLFKPDADETLVRPDTADPQVLLNYAQFLSGKINHNLRAISNHSQEKAKMFSKILEVTTHSHSSSHLSVGDLVMGGRPELQLELISKCQHCIPLLQAYSRWHKKKHLFWEWMMSVVEEEFKTNSSHLSAAGAAHLHNFLGKVKQDLQKPQIDKQSSSINNNLPLGRRLHIDQDGVIVDSMIEQMDLKIEDLTKRNQDMFDQITNRLKTRNNKDAITSILQSFFLC
ncbi:tubulin epsilon and delta complex protein 1-like [Macrosteles quadrilineatus]|uniref:tubulin epsilon and delta complex protein 1-like n=1 Tax=Macrosteles quadrilineatus TaxID=74068 RepID=UPI0023E2CDE8|nr:tubulin epsilon and delta complex protein 1-like [Macrosteles quadrilineatus]